MSPTPTLRQALVDAERLPWIPLAPGEWFKPLRFLPDQDSRVLLLRLAPGTGVPLHRHLGEVHAWNVSGSRQLHTGEVVGPGGYVYEPPGNVDSWRATGDEDVVVFIAARGSMEYLGPKGEVLRRDGAESLRERYERHCAETGIEPLDLVSRSRGERAPC